MDEQEIVNAICLATARQHSLHPEEIEVELAYDDEEGFSAEAYFNGQKQTLTTLDMIQTIRLWIDEVHHIDPVTAGIQLKFDESEGIFAEIH